MQSPWPAGEGAAPAQGHCGWLRPPFSCPVPKPPPQRGLQGSGRAGGAGDGGTYFVTVCASAITSSQVGEHTHTHVCQVKKARHKGVACSCQMSRTGKRKQTHNSTAWREGRGMSANGDLSPSGVTRRLWSETEAARHCEGTECCRITSFLMVNCMLCEIHLNKVGFFGGWAYKPVLITRKKKR